MNAELPGTDTPVWTWADPDQIEPQAAQQLRNIAALLARKPLTDEVRPVGAPGAPVQPPPPTMMTTSLDAALVPALFRARTRTKYVPAGTPVAVNDVAALNVSNTAMLVDPADDPASIT